MDNFEEIRLRGDIINGVIRTLIVNADGEYDRSSKTTFDQWTVRAAVAMALALYVDKDHELIDMMNKVQTRD